MSLRVVQVTFHPDPERRAPEALLHARFSLVSSAIGAARSGVDVSVVQAANESRTIERDGVPFHFVDDVRAAPMRLNGTLRVPRRPSRLIEHVVGLKPQVVHVHGLNYPLAIRQLTRALRGVPVLAQDHGSAPLTGLRRDAQRWALRPLAGVAFTAREQAVPFVETSVFPPSLPVFEVLGGSNHFTPGDVGEARAATGLFGDPC
ncbi:MAG TPA: glycosyltransferase, partial [Gemmatimonadaceae bacterium]